MVCQLEDVAAYVDGELAGDALSDFEAHLRSCKGCADELLTQKQLLCTLNVAFNDSRSFELPRVGTVRRACRRLICPDGRRGAGPGDRSAAIDFSGGEHPPGFCRPRRT